MTETPRSALPQVTRELIDLAESNLLGSLLVAGSDGDTGAIQAVRQIIRAEDFSRKQYRHIYRAMLAGKTDQISVAEAMHRAGTLQNGDIPAMSLMVADVIGLDCETYSRSVRTLADERRGNKRPVVRGSV